MFRPKLVGHRLCPYVQRVAMVLSLSGVAFDRVDIDLDQKPAWLKAISWFEEVPALEAVEGEWLFGSDLIVRYLERSLDLRILSSCAIARAKQECLIALADRMLSVIARAIYRDQNETDLFRSIAELKAGLSLLDDVGQPQPYLTGAAFGLVDILWVTVFRYLPVFERSDRVTLEKSLSPALLTWRKKMAQIECVRRAVPESYEAELVRLIKLRKSHLARIIDA